MKQTDHEHIAAVRADFQKHYLTSWHAMINAWQQSGKLNRVWMMYAASYLFNTGAVRWAIDPVRPNSLLADLPAEVPAEKLAYHDLGPNEQTHWPLTCGITPVARWVKALSMAGYTGVLKLEVNPARFAGTIVMSSQDAIFHGLAVLQAARSSITSRCVQ